MQAACRVAQHHIRIPGLGRRQRVKQHGAGVGSLVLAHDVHTGPLRPDLQLIGGGGTEGISGAQQHLLALILQPVGQLADGRGLTHAVDSDDESHAGPGREVQRRIAHRQLFRQNVPQGVFHVLLVGQQLGIGPLFQLGHGVHRRIHAHVRQDESLLQIVVESLVEGVEGHGLEPRLLEFCKQSHGCFLLASGCRPVI